MGLLLIEGFLRLFMPFPDYPSLVIPDEKVGLLLKRDCCGRATNRMGEYDTEIRTNQEGFRDRDYSIVKPSHVLRIAFIGDSFTLAEQVEEDQTFVRRVEVELNEILRRQGVIKQEVECMNFGIGGYDTQQEVLCYEAYVRKYKPDVVVLMMYPHNDFVGNVFYLFEKTFGRPYFRLEKGLLKKVAADPLLLQENYQKSLLQHQHHWYQYLHLYNAQKNIFYLIRQGWRRKADVALLKGKLQDSQNLGKIWDVFGYRKYRYPASREDDPFIIEVDKITRLLLNRLQTMIWKDGGRFCVALLPSEENLWPERWSERAKFFPGMERFTMDFERPFRRVQSFLPEVTMRGDLLDVRPALHNASETGPVFFRHDFHYNVRGQEAVAQILLEWLGPKIRVMLED